MGTGHQALWPQAWGSGPVPEAWGVWTRLALPAGWPGGLGSVGRSPPSRTKLPFSTDPSSPGPQLVGGADTAGMCGVRRGAWRVSPPGAGASLARPAGLGVASSRKLAQNSPWLCPPSPPLRSSRPFAGSRPSNVHTTCTEGTWEEQDTQPRAHPEHARPPGLSLLCTKDSHPLFPGQSGDPRRHPGQQRAWAQEPGCHVAATWPGHH